MITFKDFISTSSGNVHLDWNSVELTIGFNIHPGLKDFYSRVLCSDQNSVDGKYSLEEFQFDKAIKKEYDSWEIEL